MAYVTTGTLVNTRAKLLFMTEATLVAELQRDSKLSRFSTVILDEAHERSLYMDLLLSLTSEIARSANGALKLVAHRPSCCVFLHRSGWLMCCPTAHLTLPT